MPTDDPTSAVLSLGLDDRVAWDAATAGDGLPSQSWRYAQALSASGYRPRLAIVNAGAGRMLIAYREASWQSAVDVATLPGLSGASFSGDAQSALVAWRHYAVAQGWVSGYLQLGLSAPVKAEALGEPTVFRTHRFALDPQRWSLAGSTSMIIRRKLKAAPGHKFDICEGAQLTAARALPLYRQTLGRFDAHSTFTDATLMHWFADPENLAIGCVVAGQLEAFHLVVVVGTEAELHLVGYSEAGRACSAFLHVRTIEALRARGVRRYNLGGGGSPTDGLFRFKTWLGAEASPMCALHQIYDAARYDKLCSEAGTAHRDDWFPAYRARVSASSSTSE